MLLWGTVGLVFLAIVLLVISLEAFLSCFFDSDAKDFVIGFVLLWLSSGCGIWAYNLWH